MFFFSFVLFCFVLFCFVLFCFVLFCFVLFCIVLYCIVLYCIVLYCIVLYCIVLYCIVLYCDLFLMRTSDIEETFLDDMIAKVQDGKINARAVEQDESDFEDDYDILSFIPSSSLSPSYFSAFLIRL